MKVTQPMHSSLQKPRPELIRRSFIKSGTAAAALTAASWNRVLGANELVGIGVIGFGLVGRIHTRNFMAQPDAQVVALSETFQPRMDAAAELVGGHVAQYPDFRKLLEDKNVDAVVVATPDHWHALMSMMACAAGKDVYVEKPLTLFVREGRWMVETARRHKRVVQVGTQQRSGPHYQRARELIRRGRLGELVSVQCNYFRNVSPGFGHPPDGNPPPELDYDMWLGPAPLRPYNPNRSIYHFRWFWDYSGGQMTNLGAHEIDVVHWAMKVNGTTAVSSSGGRFALEDNGETPDTQDALFEYPGFTALWSHREASRGRGDCEGLEFFGTKGSMTLSRSGYKVIPDLEVAPENQIPQFLGHPAGGPQRAAR